VIYDLSVTLRPGMPTYDGEPGPELSPLKTLEADGANVSTLSQGVHSGTHVDAPIHFIPGGFGIDAYPLDSLVGPCDVVEIHPQAHIGVADLEAAGLPVDAERVIFKTPNSELWADSRFHRDFIALDPEAARWLIDRGLRLVGIDYLSIDPYDSDEKTAHLHLLGAGVVVVEGLDLRGVPPGRYTVACLPIKLEGADGAPARVVLYDTFPPSQNRAAERHGQ
jgi:arylformamidase